MIVWTVLAPVMVLLSLLFLAFALIGYSFPARPEPGGQPSSQARGRGVGLSPAPLCPVSAEV